MSLEKIITDNLSKISKEELEKGIQAMWDELEEEDDNFMDDFLKKK